ncbi:MAG TPA: TIGR03013 family XrtA/PEP-CTERM system glycosyltransferase [Rhodopila sp.]|nr:TIGR03013 family XrtA/PEP-CTERM system glycosyltransferase [Rhodopila sp.]
MSRIATGAVLCVLDVALLAAVWPVVAWMHSRTGLPLFGAQGDIQGILYPVCDLLLLFAMGLYRRDAILNLKQSLTRVPLVVGMGAAMALLGSFAYHGMVVSDYPAAHNQAELFALAIVTFSALAVLARVMVDAMLRRHVLRRRLLIIGTGQRAWELMLILGREGASLHDDVTLVHDPSQPPVDPRLLEERLEQIVRAPDFDIAAIAADVRADLIIVAPDERRGMNLERLLDCKKAGYPVMDYLTFVEREIRRIDLKRLELGWLVYSEGFKFGPLDRFLKRGFDLVASAVVLLLTAPLILGGMIAIRLEDKGPVLYRQQRVTQDGKTFWIMKLRTMRVDAEARGAVWAAARDSRITRTGSFLRRSRIDELPQLVNILRGEMSFVGPRPERPVFVAELAARLPLYNERHMVKAGLTGWAQINYPYGASIDDARSKLSYDLYYVKNFSILVDLVILLQTLRVVLWPNGAR